MHLRSLSVALLSLVACQSSGTGGAGAHGATSSSATSTSSTVPAAPASAATSAKTTTKTPSEPGVPGILKLASGATLSMPAGATAKTMNNAAKRLPGVVKAHHKYALGSDKRLLLVNEMDREGLACNAVLDRELERANKARAYADPKKQAMRKMEAITELKVGGHRALYFVSGNRAPAPGAAEADVSKPMLGISTFIMCRDEDYVVIMHAADQSSTPEETKKMLVDIAASYKPGA